MKQLYLKIILNREIEMFTKILDFNKFKHMIYKKTIKVLSKTFIYIYIYLIVLLIIKVLDLRDYFTL